MTIFRTISILSLTFAAATCFSTKPAEANDLKDLFRSIRHGRVDIKIGAPHRAPHFGKAPVARQGFYPGNHCYKPHCPPPPPIHCVFCVYYLDCHGHWLFYGKYNSRWAAKSAAGRLRYHGYRTYVKVKHLGHVGGGYPGLPPAPVLFGG